MQQINSDLLLWLYGRFYSKNVTASMIRRYVNLYFLIYYYGFKVNYLFAKLSCVL